MKKLFISILALIVFSFLFSCNDSTTTKESAMDSTNTDTAKKEMDAIVKMVDTEKWRIDSATADKLMKHRFKPGNDLSNIVSYNDTVRDAIHNKYPTCNLVWVEARYKDDADEIRYKTNWNIPDVGGARNPKAKVKGYKTKILQVECIVAAAHPEYIYYDIAAICPPPNDGSCSIQPAPTAKDSTKK